MITGNDDKKQEPLPEVYAPVPPPAYAPSGSIPAGIPTVNYLYIAEKQKPIEGKWIVDPLRRIPEAIMPKVGKGQQLDNVNLSAQHAKINAELYLTSASPCRASLWIDAKHGGVTLSIPVRQNQRFRLYCASKHGGVTVYLPRDFEGPLTYANEEGKLTLSKGIQDSLTPIGGNEQKHTVFIGRWEMFTEENGAGTPSWIGDEAILDSKHSKINVAFIDEMPLDSQD